MSILGMFANSEQAIQAQSDALGVISQNIANVNTDGYKAIDTHFQTLLSQSTAGTNIFGVQFGTENHNDVEGSFATTGLWDNLAVNGPGFFVLNTALDGSGTTSYTRDGNFTEAVFNSTDVDLTKPATSAGSVSYLTDGNGDFLMGWKANNGIAATPDSLSGLTAVGIALGSTAPGQATSQIALQGSIPSNAANGTATSGVPVYDNSGNTQTLQMTFTQTASDEWAVTYSLPPAVGAVTTGTSTTLDFDGAGNFLSQGGASTVPIKWADGTSSNITVDFSKMSQLASGNLIVNAQTQNGFSPSTLVKAEVDPNGNVYGDYTNGQKALLYTLPVANFTAPNALQSTSDTDFQQTAAAGTLALEPATSTNTTSIVSGAVESSNVDLGTEFSDLIQTQTAYNSATKLFNVTDQMTQTLRDLVT